MYRSDARGDRVSVASPLGDALLGASVGSTIDGDAGTFNLASIAYQPEAAGDHHL